MASDAERMERIAAQLGAVGKPLLAPTPGIRLERTSARIAAAYEAKAVLEASGRRCETGLPRWRDWNAVVGPDADRVLERFVGSLLIREARREHPAPAAAASDGDVGLAMELLSHRPGVEPPPELLRQIAALRPLPFDPAARVERRFSAATGLLLLGPEDGRPRREELWSSGLVQQAGSDRCDPDAWLVRSLIDWDAFDRRMSDLSQQQGNPVLEDGERYDFTYSEAARLIRDINW